MSDPTCPDPRAQWCLRLSEFHRYNLIRSKLFEFRRGLWMHVLGFCLDDPEQGPVVVLPIMQRERLEG